jgi:glycerol-3-phosphate acyltransferase PlsY
MTYFAYLFAAIVGYLLGSIPFGLLITQAAGLGDVRKIGSGNIGATNVLRTGRRELAALTLILDAAKGFAAVMIARYFWPGDAIYVAAIAVFLGHCFPVWLGFKGGKGVATFIGVLLGLAWPVGVIFCVVWLIIAAARRISSLAALTAAVTSPIFAYVSFLMGFGPEGIKFAATVALIAALVIYNHRSNIGRLINGTEPKIGSEKKTSEPG